MLPPPELWLPPELAATSTVTVSVGGSNDEQNGEKLARSKPARESQTRFD